MSAAPPAEVKSRSRAGHVDPGASLYIAFENADIPPKTLRKLLKMHTCILAVEVFIFWGERKGSSCFCRRIVALAVE
jgi:hypothetical protein